MSTLSPLSKVMAPALGGVLLAGLLVPDCVGCLVVGGLLGLLVGVKYQLEIHRPGR